MREYKLPFKNLADIITDTFFLPECPICKNQCDSFGICENCNNALEIFDEESKSFEICIDNFTVKCFSKYSYKNDSVIKLLLYLKENNSQKINSFAALKLSTVISTFMGEEMAVFTNVPRSKNGMQKYGFDQAENLARETAHLYDNVKFHRLFKRKGFSKQQKELTFHDRKVNMKGKIKFIHKRFVKECTTIVIFDDVITTGNSVAECANVLHKVYPDKRIYAVSLAKQAFSD